MDASANQNESFKWLARSQSNSRGCQEFNLFETYSPPYQQYGAATLRAAFNLVPSSITLPSLLLLV